MTRARDLSRLGNSNAITATTSNNIGIGTTTPDTKLDVVGDAFITGVVTATSYSGDGSNLTGIDATQIVTGNTSVQTVDTGSDGRVLINTEGVERVRVNSSGNVGIGTDNPSRKLVVNGGTSEGVVQITNNTSGFAVANGFELIHFTNGETQLLNRENGDMRFDTNGTERLRITSSGDIKPGADATQDLGATDRRFANIYSADLQLSNEGSSNDVDGTWGKYTIQEGEDDLFLINRRTGRKYKFLLEEVN